MASSDDAATIDGLRRRAADPLAETDAGADAPPAATRTMFGRYLVIERLGRGGMGEVAVAYDPDLDRRIALKRVRADASSRSPERLLREAQAMAKIRHPNVVAVFDVGQLGDEVFIAMELVAGETLRVWMGRDHAIDEILDVFEQAGRGLHAAHRIGIVHRDFKPDNAMIDEHGRVQVLDFGLAASMAGPRAPAATDADGVDTHATAGTPAYMAPEQYEGRPADALCDQFALCVALFEAIHGVRPFVGDTLPSLCAAVLAGRVTEPPHPRPIPRWLDAIVRRGLARDPGARWPDLDSLLDALARGRARQRRNRQGVIAIGAVGVVAGLAMLRARTTACEDAAAPVDVAWNDATRQRLATTFAASSLPLARSGGSALLDELEGRAAAWRSAYEQTCLAADGDAAARELADRRRVCLHEQLGALSGTVEVLGMGDDEVIVQAAKLVGSLPDPRACDDPTREAGIGDPVRQQQITAATATLRSLLVAGKPAEAAQRLPEVRRQLGEGVEVDASLGVVEARIQRDLGHSDRALALLDATYLAARRQGTRAAILAVEREFVVVHLTRHEGSAAMTWIERARIEAEALGDERALAVLAGKRAMALGDLGRYDEAIAASEAALAAFAALGLDDSLDALDVAANLGGFLFSAGRLDEAIARKRDALARATVIYGAEHPMTAQVQADVGTILGAKGDDAGAQRELRHALTLLHASFTEPHPRLGEVMASLAAQLTRSGEFAEAVQLGERALANLEPDTARIALVYNNHALALARLGRHTEAVIALRRSLEIKQRLLPPQHPDLGLAFSNYAELIAEDGDVAAVRGAYERALEIHALNDDAAHLASVRADYALWLARHGDPTTARRLAEQVLASAEANDGTRRDATRALADADARTPRPADPR